MSRGREWRLNREKLFWLRTQLGWSQEKAAEQAGISDKRHYIRLERGYTLQPRARHLAGLARAFGVMGAGLRLGVGESPDPLHLSYYRTHKEARVSETHRESFPGPSPCNVSRTRLVAMDVDGTVIQGLDFSWRLVWQTLGYPDHERRVAMQGYLDGRLKYREWCDLCAAAFRRGGLTRSHFTEMARNLQVLENFRHGASRLRRAGVLVVAISGGIDALLEAVFPDYADYFDDVSINHFEFDPRGRLVRIVPTPYDFKGKLTRIKELKKLHGLRRNEIAFVGEGLNDRFVAGKVGTTIALCPRDQSVEEGFEHVLKVADFNGVMEILQR